MQTKIPKKKRNSGLIGLILLLTIISGVIFIAFTSFQTESRSRLEDCKTAFNEGDWHTAWLEADQLSDLYSFFHISIPDEIDSYKDQSSLLAFGVDSSDQGDYPNALMAYNTYLKLFPESGQKQQILNNLREMYVDWGGQLRKNNQPDLAYQKYLIVQDKYPGTSAAKEAQTAIPDTLLEWAETLKNNKQFEKVEKLLTKIVVDFPDSAAAKQANSQIASTYAMIGKQQFEKNNYLFAMQAYSKAQLLPMDQETKETAAKGYQDAVLALSTDTGEDGQQIITDIMKSACQRELTVFPIVGIANEKPARGRICQDSMPGLNFPSEWEAITPADLEYVIKLVSRKIEKETCYYTEYGELNLGEPTYALIFRDWEITVTVIQAKTGGVIESKTFSSSSSYSCPATRMFALGFSKQYEDSNSQANSDDILNWLRTFFE